VIGKLRIGELLALAGVACLVLSLLQPWYQTPAGNLDLWDTFGPAAALLLATLSAALAVVTAALTERDSPALPVSTAVWCVLLGLIGSIAALVRVLERPDHATGLSSGAWLGLAGALLALLGAWLVLRDERPGRYRPARPEPRPRP
jgi:drug/metabolite transporter (DMT)-like permease